MVKTCKLFLLSILFLCGLLVDSVLYGAGPYNINTKAETTQTWQVEGSDESVNKATFKDAGAIETSRRSANISGQPGPLIVDFQNDPTIDVPEIGATKKAHIYAKNTNGSVIALQLSDDVNLKFIGSSALFPELSADNLENQKRVGIFASVGDGNYAQSTGIDVGNTTGIGDGITTFDREIIFAVPTEIYAKIEGGSCVAATVIGQASGNINISLDSNIRYVIANNNEFVSSSSSSDYNTSVVIGVASGGSSSTVSGANTFDIGSSNIFTSSSHASTSGGTGANSYSSSVVIGAVSGYRDSTVSGANTFDIGSSNVFTSSSYAYASAGTGAHSYPSSVVIGAAGGRDSTVSGANTFDIGSSNIFTSSSYAYASAGTGANSYPSSVVIGVASGGSSSTVSEANTFDIGSSNIFTSSSYAYASATFVESYSASAAIGAASGYGTSTAKGMSLNINGSQMIGALAGTKVNAFGADNTDADANKTGWRIGLYNSETNAATVNILAAKGSVAFSDDQATVTLNADQGSDRTNYARAFALGNDYQIYIGGQGEVTRDADGKLKSIGTELKGSGNAGTANIFGAIAPAQNATLSNNRCANSSLTVDKSWTANAYSPVEGLENVKVIGGSKLKTFGKVSNIGTLTIGDSTTSGEVVVYKEATLGTTVLDNGVLKAGACTNNGAATALNNMTKGKSSLPLKFANPEDNAKVCDVTSINSTDYVKNFGTVGTLTLDGEVTFKVNTSKVDANVGTKVGDKMTDQFQLVKGYIELEKTDSTFGKLELGTSGKFTIVDESTSTIDPENRALMFVRASGLNVEQMLGTQFMSKFTAVNTGLYALNSDANLLTNTGLIVGKVNIYAKDGIGIGLMNEEYAKSVNTVDGGVSTPGAIVKGPLNIIIQTPETEGHTWALYGDAAGGNNDISTNKITFKDEGSTKGSISVSDAGGTVVAANITFDDDVLAAANVTDLKKKSLLTMDFQNEPTVDVPEIDATKKAHIYAKNTFGSVTALQLSDNVNLKFTGSSTLFPELSAENLANQKRVGIFAYSGGSYTQSVGIDVGNITGIGDGITTFDREVIFAVPTEIYAKIEANGSSNVAATVIGRATDDGTVSLDSNIRYVIANNNEFVSSSSSSSNSASAVIGAASGDSGSTVSGNNTFGIGDNNKFISSSSSYDSASVVIGAASGYGGSIVSGNNVFGIGNNNTFMSSSSSSSSSSYGASVVIGAASGYRNSTVSGNNVFGIGDNNTFTSSSSSNGASVVIGAANFIGSANVTGNKQEYLMNGSNNTFASSSLYASAVIGAASCEGSANVAGDGIYEVGNNNTFVVSAAGGKEMENPPFAVSTVMGSASLLGNAIVSGDSIYAVKSGNVFSSLSSSLSPWMSNYDKLSISPVSASTVFGASESGFKPSDEGVTNDGISMARNATMNINGSQTISALAYSGANRLREGGDENNLEDYDQFFRGTEKVNTFGADNTDAEAGKAGWRIGIYNDAAAPATVNILGAKLAENVIFADEQDDPNNAGEKISVPRENIAIVLDADQGRTRTDSDETSFGNNNYARAFALGNDYQIYIGGQGEVTRDADGKLKSIGTELKGSGNAGTANIFGAIAPAQNATLDSNNRCANSSLTIDKNWTANAYSPVEGLENVKVIGGGKLKTFGKVSNIGTLTIGDSTTSGEVVVYKEATLGTTVLDNGVLKAGACTDNGAATAMNNMTKGRDANHPDASAPILKFANPEDNAKVCDVTSINSTDYVKNLGTVGTLTLDGEVTFKVDTSKIDANVGSKVDGKMTNQFQLVKGYIALEKTDSTCGKLELGTNGKFTIADESTTTIDPENRALMFVRASGLNVEQMLGTQFMSKFTAVSGISGLYALNSDANLLTNTGLIVGKVNVYAKDGIGIGLMNEEYARSVNTVDGEITGEIVLKKPLNIIVRIPEGNKTPEGENRVWALYGDASDDPSKSIASNRVTFTNETKDGTTTLGSISVSGTSGSVVAANIKFDDDVLAAANATDLKKKSLLTMDFQNEPSIDVPEIDAAKKAHIYAKNTNGSATALQLSDNVNLKFTGSSALFPELSTDNSANQKRVGIFAYSSTSSGSSQSIGIDIGNTTGTGDGVTTFDREIIFAIPTEIYAKMEGNGTNTATAAIGRAAGQGPTSLNGNIRYIVANNNKFDSYSFSPYDSASVVIGAATGNDDSTVNGNHTFDIGTGNTFTSSSSSFSYSVSSESGSAVIGAASANRNSTVSGNNMFDIGTGNTFTSSSSSSSSSSCSASVVMGAASGRGNPTVNGNNIFNIGIGNRFTSSSSSSSRYGASVVIGAASGFSGSVIVNGNNVFDIGIDNKFTSSSASSRYDASVVIGAACGFSGSVTVKGNNVFDIETGNTFTSSSSSSSDAFYSAATVIGSASGDNSKISTARGTTLINMNGSQMIGALAGAKVNAFGADNTDADANKAGWRVGLYNSGTNAATVNILAAKGSTAFSDDQATVTLNADQGSDRTNYARAFALGNDYQIYIGGQGEVTRDSDGKLKSIGTELKGSGKAGTANIFGAIAPAQNATLSDNRCANSSLTIDKNWTANAYSPVEGLENVKVIGGSKLKTFGKVSNIGTLTIGDSTTSGEVVVYKEATLGTTVLDNGVLKAGACTDNGAATALNNMTKGKTSLPLKFTNPEDNAKLCDVTSINSTDYVKNFGTVGTLTLDGEVTFKVDTSKVDANVGSKVGDKMTDQFQLVKGYIALDKVVDGENTTCGKLELGSSGKFTIADESATTIDPENRALMFVRASGLNVEQMLGTQFMSKFTAVSGISGLYALNSDANLLTNTGLIVGKVNVYAKDGIGIGLMNEEYAKSVNTVDGGASTPGAIIKEPLNIIVRIPEGNKTPEGEDRVWALYGDASDDPSKSITSNRVTFTNETKDGTTTLGSISVSNAGGTVVAANIKFDDDVLAADNVTDLKKKSLLTMDFQNEPTVEVSEIDAAKKAHIYAKNTNGSVTALQLDDNLNLKFTGSSELFPELSAKDLGNQKRVGIFAYSGGDSSQSIGIDVGNTTGVEDGITTFDREIIFEVPTEIYSIGSGAVSVIGRANGDGAVSLDSNIRYVIANNNEFTSSSSSSFSASAVIGAASGNGNSIVSGNNVFNIGTNNLFTSSSGVSSVVIGAVSREGGNASVTGDKHEYTVIGADNTFTSSSGVSSVVIGAASTRNASVTGDKHEYTVIGADNTFSSFAENYAAAVIGATSKRGIGSVDVREAIFKIEGDRNTFTSSSGVSSVVIGAVSDDDYASVTGDKHEYTVIGADNTFSSSSGYSSVMIGAAGLFNASVDVKEAIFKIEGDRNTFTSSSSGYCSVVIGAVSDDDYASVTGDKHEYTIIGADNTFSSFAENYAAAVIGAAGYGASVDVKEAIFEIEGDKNTFSSYSGYSSVVIGAASSDETSTARGISININGSQMIGALAGTKVNAFGADNTDAEAGKTGWRIGLYNSETNAATMNILAAKGSTAFDNDQATVTLNADQGSDRTNYARAFALGSDYQIYIGGQGEVTRDADGKLKSIGTELKGSGNAGTANIFGAIAPAQNATLTDTSLRDAEIIRVPDTRFTVDHGWTANVYGPLEGVESIAVKDGGVLNTYGSLRNITLEKGIINVYGKSDGIGTIVLKNGTLNLKHCEENGAKTALDAMASKIKFANPSDNGKLCEVSSIDSTEYVKNFGNNGKLILKSGDSLCFYVNTDLPESQTGNSVLATGYIEIEDSLSDAVDFAEGSKVILVNTGTQPFQNEERKFILIRGKNMTVQELLGNDDFESLTPVEGREKAWSVGALGQWIEDQEDAENEAAAYSASDSQGGAYSAANPLKRMVRALAAPLADGSKAGEDSVKIWLEETDDNYAQMILGREMTLTASDPDNPSLPGIGSSSAQINTAVVSMFRNAIGPRLAGVDGNVGDHGGHRGDGAFIYGIGGHVHQSSIAGIGYGGDLYGVTAGADKLLNYKDGCVRLGAMIGYVYGDIDFHGSAIGKKQKSKQDNYLCALYGAYESINEKNLKTDLNLSCGFGYTKHRLNRVDQKDLGYNAKMKSNNFFLSAEFIKNLYAVQGIQFGLWLKADYNHIHQKAYSEKGGAGAQSISKAKFDFLDTTIGVNIEKEIQNSANLDRSLRLYMKAGWNCQPMRSHSTIVAGVNGKNGVVSPHFGSRNSAVFIAGLRQKLNAHWDLIGEWNGSFNKKHSNNLVTLGAGYTF